MNNNATVSGTNTGDQTINLTGDLTGSGVGTFSTTLASSGVTAGSYGSATLVPTFTVDAKGRLTNVANTTISGVSPVGSAMGSGKIIVGDALGVASIVDMSGDVTIDYLGVTTIGNNKITTDKVLNSNITYSKIQDVTTGKVLGRTSANNGIVEEIATTGTGDVVRAISPTFSGAPQVLTPIETSNDGTIASTEFVKRAISNIDANAVDGIISGEKGGTGVANTNKTITLGGNFATSGAYSLMFTTTGATNVSLPTSGTLATVAQLDAIQGGEFSGGQITGIVAPKNGGTGIDNTGKTITLGGSLLTGAAFTTTGTTGSGNAAEITLKTTAATDLTLPTTGTLATLNGTETLTNKTITAAANSISGLTNANLSGTAGITDANLATISTAGKIANTATTATNANTINAIVARDASGNFIAGTITAALAGNANTATKLATPISIYGNNFDGTANLGQVIAPAYGGTGNAFTKFTGATSSEKIYNLPDANTTILTTNALITPAQGGTGVATAAMNTFFSGPSSGSDAAPSFRPLSASDLPAGNGSYIANSTVQQANSNFNISGDGIAAGSLTAGSIIKQGGTAAQFLKANGSVDDRSFATLTGSETLTNKIINGVTPTAVTTGFTIAGGLTNNRTLTVAANANVAGTNTGDVALSGQDYLSISNQTITAAPVNLSGTNATGILAAARFPALTGDITNAEGSVATTISNDAITSTKIADNAVTSTKIADNAVTEAKIVNGAVSMNKIASISIQTLLGNKSNSAAASPGEITIGTGLALNPSTGVLSASGSGGTVSNVSALSVTASGSTLSSTVANASSTPVISLNIPLASVTGTTAGLISKSDYDAFAAKTNSNDAITGATKTKITYDSKGLVTAGADATTADIAPSTNRRYVTDAQAGVISNTSGTNTGDQTITLTGAVTGSGNGSFATTLSDGVVTTNNINNTAVSYAKIQNMSAKSLIGNKSLTAGVPGEITIGTGLALDAGTGVLSASGSGGTVTGTGTAGQLPYWSSTSGLGGNPNFTWDNTNKIAKIGEGVNHAGVDSYPTTSMSTMPVLSVIGKVNDVNEQTLLRLKRVHNHGSSYEGVFDFVSSGGSDNKAQLDIRLNSPDNVNYKNLLSLENQNGNVGINNTAPTEKLDVAGNIKFSGVLKPNNLAGNAGQVLTSQGASTAPIWVTPSTGMGGSGTINYISKFNTNTTTLANSNLFDDGTSVMINSNSTSLAGGVALLVSDGANAAPATSGTNQSAGALRIRGGDNTVIDFGTVSSKPWIQTGDAANLGTNHPLYINPNGGTVAIGLGTASATSTSKLQVNGDVGATTFNSVGLKMNTNKSIVVGSGAPSVTGGNNISIGEGTLNTITTAGENIAIGYQSMYKTNTEENTAVGHMSMFENTGRFNTAIGFKAGYDNTSGYYNTSGDYNTFLGYKATASLGNLTNATAIGNGAVVSTSNTMQLGNANITNLKTFGTITAGNITYPKTYSGTPNQVLTIDAFGVASFNTLGAAGATLTSGKILVGNVSNIGTEVSLSGDVSMTNTGSTTLTNTTVSAGSYGSSSAIPTFTVDSKGRLTAASSVAIIAGVNSLNYTSTTSYAAGGTISGTSLTLSAANVTNPGLVSTGVQTFSGSKTFSGTIVSTSTNASSVAGKFVAGTNTAASASAVLEANSTTQGFLPPRMTLVQRDAIASPATGLIVMCSDCGVTNGAQGELQIFNGLAWRNIAGTEASGTTTGVTAPAIGSSLQGGVVAYILAVGDPGYEAGKVKGFIASTTDVGAYLGRLDGGSRVSGITNTDLTLGTGLSNFNKLVTAYGTVNSSAVKLAYDYSVVYDGVTYDDWYIPSKNELLKLYANKTAIGNFALDGTFYWTSNQCNGASTAANYIRFTDGFVQCNGTEQAGRLRVIRNFTIDPETGITATNFNGNATTASALTTGRTISATGDITYTSGAFDGSANVTGTATLTNTTVTAGSYGSSTAIPIFTVDSKGRLTAANTVGIIAGVNSLNYTSSTSYAAGGTISGTSLTLAAADATNPGLLSTGAQTIAGSKTFTGTITAPVYSSSPVALTAGAIITWAPMSGLNASVTLNANSTLAFGTTPPAGSSGTLIVTQPASGSTYTLALPSAGTHRVLGSASGITLSTTNNAKDIVSFYYDGTTYYWNVGIGYGTAQSLSANSLTGGVAGAIPYQTATNTTGFTDAGTTGYYLTSQGTGKPTWTAPTTSVTSFSAGTTGLTPNSTTTGAVTLAGTLGATNGGTGQTSYTTGDILYSSATNTLSKLTAGTNGHVLTLSSGVPTWAAASGGITGSGTQNYLPKYNNAGGTTLGSSAISDDGTTVSINNPVTLNNKTIAGGSAAVNAITATTYSLVQADNGKVITMNNASAITLTIPSGLTAGFNCMIVQYGAGTVTIVGASGVTVVNRSNYNKTGGQYAIVTIVSPVANTFITGGDMQ